MITEPPVISCSRASSSASAVGPCTFAMRSNSDASGCTPRDVEARDVHARRVEVADLLRRRALCCRPARPRGLLQQVAQLRLRPCPASRGSRRSPACRRESSPRRASGRPRSAGSPAADRPWCPSSTARIRAGSRSCGQRRPTRAVPYSAGLVGAEHPGSSSVADAASAAPRIRRVGTERLIREFLGLGSSRMVGTRRGVAPHAAGHGPVEPRVRAWASQLRSFVSTRRIERLRKR